MLINYFKTAIRNLLRHKGYSFINITGLSIGMAACILLVLYIQSELSFDRYHQHSDRIYRLCMNAVFSGTEITGSRASNAVTGPALSKDFPEVAESVRFRRMRRPVIRYKEKQFTETDIRFADASVFKVFSWPLVSGDAQRALLTPYCIVITETLAKKYFGDEEPLGKVLRFNDSDNYTVTGVMKDIPINSHFQVNALCSFKTIYAQRGANDPILTEWIFFNFRTYVLMQPGADYRDLEKKFPALLEKHAGEKLRGKGATIEFFLQPLKEIRLYNPGDQGNDPILYIYIFAAVAGFVLLIACVNFMNLSTARSANRAMEVGIRKVLGADRKRLISQFLMDAMLVSFVSMASALLLVELSMPVLGDLAGRPLSLDFAASPWLLPGIIGLTLFTGLLAGSYPAFFLTSFRPIKVLKGDLKSGAAGSRLRRLLVLGQFTVSIILIISTGLMIKQLNFMRSKDPGFNKEQVLMLRGVDDKVRQMLPVIKEELKRYHGVVNVAAASTVPGWGHPQNDTIPEGYSETTTQLMGEINVGPDYIPTMGIQITEGRNFSTTFETGGSRTVLINETAAKQYGWKEPLGKTIKVRDPEDVSKWITYTVIGVVKDVHFAPITQAHKPVIIRNMPNNRYTMYRAIMIRIAPEEISGTLDFLKKKWEQLVPHKPFNAVFLDESFDAQFWRIRQTRDILFNFTLLAIFIACLGLFGMASFTAQKRTKEIGIRKVLGASVSRISVMLAKEFTQLVLAANIIAWPAAYLIMEPWMENFPYRTGIGIGVFILSGLAALVIALLTVSFQSVRAAASNPVDALKYE